MKKIILSFALCLFVLFAIGQIKKTGYYYSLGMLKDGNYSIFHGFFDLNQMKDSNIYVKFKSINELLDYRSSVNYYDLSEEKSLYSCCELQSYSKGMEMFLMGTLDTNYTSKYDSLSKSIGKKLSKKSLYTFLQFTQKDIKIYLSIVKIDAQFCECVGYQNMRVGLIKKINKISKVKRKERLAFKRFILSHLE